MKLLIPMLLISIAAAGADIRSSRTLNATASVSTAGDPHYYGDVDLWIVREPGKPVTARLNCDLLVCTGSGPWDCRVEEGYGEIPLSATTVGKDTVTLDIDTASLPPPYSRQGVGGRFVAEWRIDGMREETITGTRTVMKPDLWTHQPGQTTIHSASVNLIAIGVRMPARSAAITESHSTTIIKQQK